MFKTLIFVLIVGTAVADKHEHQKDHPDHHHSQPYHFGYQIKDKHGSQFRKEEGNGHGSVKGSYGYTDEHGIYREVHYVADHHGFRAEIKTNEPGTANQDPAQVKIHSHASHHHHYDHHRHEKHYNDQHHKHDPQTHHKFHHHGKKYQG